MLFCFWFYFPSLYSMGWPGQGQHLYFTDEGTETQKALLSFAFLFTGLSSVLHSWILAFKDTKTPSHSHCLTQQFSSSWSISKIYSGDLQMETTFVIILRHYLPFLLSQIYSEYFWRVLSQQMKAEVNMKSQLSSIKPDLREICKTLLLFILWKM